MIGHVIGRAGKSVKGENDRTVPRLYQNRRNRKVFVPVSLAGRELGGFAHAVPAACARPFHIPPRPRQNCTAESSVKTA